MDPSWRGPSASPSRRPKVDMSGVWVMESQDHGGADVVRYPLTVHHDTATGALKGKASVNGSSFDMKGQYSEPWAEFDLCWGVGYTSNIKVERTGQGVMAGSYINSYNGSTGLATLRKDISSCLHPGMSVVDTVTGKAAVLESRYDGDSIVLEGSWWLVDDDGVRRLRTEAEITVASTVQPERAGLTQPTSAVPPVQQTPDRTVVVGDGAARAHGTPAGGHQDAGVDRTSVIERATAHMKEVAASMVNDANVKLIAQLERRLADSQLRAEALEHQLLAERRFRSSSPPAGHIPHPYFPERLVPEPAHVTPPRSPSRTRPAYSPPQRPHAHVETIVASPPSAMAPPSGSHHLSQMNSVTLPHTRMVSPAPVHDDRDRSMPPAPAPAKEYPSVTSLRFASQSEGPLCPRCSPQRQQRSLASVAVPPQDAVLDAGERAGAEPDTSVAATLRTTPVTAAVQAPSRVPSVMSVAPVVSGVGVQVPSQAPSAAATPAAAALQASPIPSAVSLGGGVGVASTPAPPAVSAPLNSIASPGASGAGAPPAWASPPQRGRSPTPMYAGGGGAPAPADRGVSAEPHRSTPPSRPMQRGRGSPSASPPGLQPGRPYYRSPPGFCAPASPSFIPSPHTAFRSRSPAPVPSPHLVSPAVGLGASPARDAFRARPTTTPPPPHSFLDYRSGDIAIGAVGLAAAQAALLQAAITAPFIPGVTGAQSSIAGAALSAAAAASTAAAADPGAGVNTSLTPRDVGIANASLASSIAGRMSPPLARQATVESGVDTKPVERTASATSAQSAAPKSASNTPAGAGLEPQHLFQTESGAAVPVPVARTASQTSAVGSAQVASGSVQEAPLTQSVNRQPSGTGLGSRQGSAVAARQHTVGDAEAAAEPAAADIAVARTASQQSLGQSSAAAAPLAEPAQPEPREVPAAGETQETHDVAEETTVPDPAEETTDASPTSPRTHGDATETEDVASVSYASPDESETQDHRTVKSTATFEQPSSDPTAHSSRVMNESVVSRSSRGRTDRTDNATEDVTSVADTSVTSRSATSRGKDKKEKKEKEGKKEKEDKKEKKEKKDKEEKEKKEKKDKKSDKFDDANAKKLRTVGGWDEMYSPAQGRVFYKKKDKTVGSVLDAKVLDVAKIEEALLEKKVWAKATKGDKVYFYHKVSRGTVKKLSSYIEENAVKAQQALAADQAKGGTATFDALLEQYNSAPPPEKEAKEKKEKKDKK